MGTKKTAKRNLGFWQRHRHLKNWLLWGGGGIALTVALVYTAFQISPWPNSLLIRHEMQKGGQRVAKSLEKYVPATVTSVDNQQYRQHDKDGYLDVFYPKHTTGALPTVVWVHGGAWISGDKDDVDNYLKILASYGYTTIGVDYTVAPEAQYPTPLLQLNDALRYLQQNAQRLHIDTTKIVLAGDSAGSQITAQMANIITSPTYATEVGIQPRMTPAQLKGTLLNCGAYDLSLPNYSGPFGDFLHTVLWAYSGKKDFLSDPKLKQASVANYLTPQFPPAFITAGNADPLEEQSTELATRLDKLGVKTSTLFYSQNHQPQLNHEYQFELDTKDARQALNQMLEFLSVQTQ